MTNLTADLKYSLRFLVKNPGFTAVAVLTLALAIGANTAIFSVVNAIAFRNPEGVTNPDELVDMGNRGMDNISYPNYVDYRIRNSVFSDLLAYRAPSSSSFRAGDSAERVYASAVSGNYFSVLGISPATGRFFLPEEDVTPSTHPVAVISFDLWRRSLGSDERVLGRLVYLNGYPFTIVGVAPRGFFGPNLIRTDLWIPAMMVSSLNPIGDELLQSRTAMGWLTIGRLKPGVSVDQAQVAMNALRDQLEEDYPASQGRSLVVAALGMVPGRVGQVVGFFSLLLAATVLILAVACTNLAGMLMARASARNREIAIRVSVGATRRRLLSQLITESLVLFIISGTSGIFASIWMCDLLLRFRGQLPISINADLSIDWRVLAFTMLVTLTAAIATSVLPAFQTIGKDFNAALRISPGAYRKQKLRSLIVISQVAFSLLLLFGGGLFVRTVQQAQSIHPGFDPLNVETVQLNLFSGGYREGDGSAFVQRLLEQVASVPGVEAVSAARDLPLDGARVGLGPIQIPGIGPLPEASSIAPGWNMVTPGYFTTMKIPLLAGRDFTGQDREGSPHVAIISEAMARQFWSVSEAIGRTIINDGETIRIVGVVKDIKNDTVTEMPQLFIYAPFAQQYRPDIRIVARHSGTSAVPAIRQVIRNLNPNLPVTNIMSLSEVTNIGLLPQRVVAWIGGVLGIVGLLLTSIGIYGVTSYSVGQRTREIGIRVALGARRFQILCFVAREALGLSVVGMGIGFGLAIVIVQFLSPLLLDTRPDDPYTLCIVSGLFGVMILIASYTPARRALKVDPSSALRME